MKRLFRHICIAAAAATGVFFVSCDNKDNEGVNSNAQPSIRYVRPCDAAQSDSLLTAAYMGTKLAIIGDGLEGVHEVWFNDQKAKLRPTMVTGHSIIAEVPGTKPDYVTDQIRVVTKKGKEATHPFKVVVPVPRPRSMKCEYVPEGQTAVIYGNFFYADNDGGGVEVKFPGNISAEIVEFNDNEIQCIVPAGAGQGPLTVRSVFGSARSPFVFRDSQGLFIEGSAGGWDSWGRSVFRDDEDSVSGEYIYMKDKGGNWSWNEKLSLFFFNPVREPIVTEGAPMDYALRFEIWSKGWNDTQMYIWFSDGDSDIDSPDVSQCIWTPFIKGGVKENWKTDGWETVTIPLTEFRHNKNTGNDQKPIPSVNTLVDCFFFIFGAADDDTSKDIELLMDNFRIVKL